MAEQKSNVFRNRSLERLSSPEQLNDYLRVTGPGIWAMLAAVILLLVGFFSWSMVGDLETLSGGVAVVKDGTAQIMVTETVSSKKDVKAGMPVRFGDDEYEISSVENDDYGRIVAYAPVAESDGRYDVKIVTESIHPISFLFS